jgi:hypothetical protein
VASDPCFIAKRGARPLGKQCVLTAVFANDKARHRILPSKSQENHIIGGAFLHSLGHSRRFDYPTVTSGPPR